MNRRARVIALLAFGLLVSLTFFLRERPADPVHEGKRLSAWMRDLDGVSFDLDELYYDRTESDRSGLARHAIGPIRKIGTNGIPFIIRELEARDSLLNRGWNEFARRTRFYRLLTPTAGSRRHRAMAACVLLKHDATDAVPTLIEILRSRDAMTRHLAAETLGNLRTVAASAVPALANALHDADPLVRTAVAEALDRIRLHPEIAVPALISSLHDSDSMVRCYSASALGNFRRGAQPAIPALKKFLTDPDRGIRDMVRYALVNIDPDGEDIPPEK